MGLKIDLAFARGRVIPATAVSYRGDRGAIAGRVQVEAPEGFQSFDLKDLVVAINGHPAGRTTAAAGFSIANLRPGLHSIGLDREHLPIQLVLAEVAIVAEVAAAAVTRVDLVVRPEFGLAGRVTDRTGRGRAGIVVELVDPDGELVGTAVTDQFGL